jgi:PAS domain S-box-containing protein
MFNARVTALEAELAAVRAELAEAREALEAIRTGQVDTLVVVPGEGGERIFTLEGAATLSATVTDLTEHLTLARAKARRESDEALLASEKRYRDLVSLSPEPIAVHADDRWLFANQAALELFGAAAPEAFIGRPVMDMVDPQDRTSVQDRVRALSQGQGGSTVPLKIRMRRLDGTPIEVEGSDIAIDFNGQPATLIVLRDITQRKLAEEALRSSEAKFARAFQAVPSMMGIARVRDGEIFDVNDAFTTATGYAREELLGRTSNQLGLWADPADRDRMIERLRQSGQVTEQEMTFRRKDGSLGYGLYSVCMIRIGGEECTLFAMADISERKQAEVALQESDERFRLALRFAPISVAVQDRNLVFQWAYNQRTWPPEEIVGKTDADLFAPEDAVWIQELKRALLATGQEMHVARWVTSNGQRVFLDLYFQPMRDATSEITGIGIATVNLTEQRRAEEALRSSEATLRGILDAVQEGIWLFGADGRVRLANSTALARFGRPAAEVIGQSTVDILPPDLAASRLQCYQQVIDSGQPLEFEDTRAGIQFHHSFYPVFDAEGRVDAIASFSRDITESSRAQAALRESEERYRLLAETMLQGVVHQDAEGTIMAMNPAAERILGKSREEFLGHTSESVEHHTVREDGSPFPGLEHPAMVALRTGQSVRGVVMGVFNPREQSRRWIRIDALPLFRLGTAQPFQVYTVFDDITARKLAEEQLRASEAALRVSVQNLKTVMETAPVAICVAHDRHCQDIAGNAQANLLLGVPMGENLSATPEGSQAIPYQVLRDGSAVAGPDLPMQRAARTGAVTTEEEYEIVRPNGSRIVILMSATPLRDDAGAIAGAVGTFLDISERKLAEVLLEQRVAERTSELDRTNRALQMIMECNQILVRVQEESALVQQICGTIRRLGGYRMAWVGLAEQDEAKTVRPIAWDGEGGDYLDQARITWADEPRGRGPTGSCLRLRKARLNRDFLTEPDVAPWRNRALQQGFRSSLALPLLWEDQLFGALTIYSERPDGFDQDQVVSLTELAEDLAFGIAAIRSRADRDLARGVAEQRADMLHTLAAELIQTEKRERQKLAQILHDHVQQLLLAAKLRLETLSGKTCEEGVRSACDSVEDLLAQAIQSSRSLAIELSPPVLQEKGLLAAVEWLSRQMQERYSLHVEVLADEHHYALTPQLFTFLFDAIRELLFNVIKHAGVDHAEVRLVESDGWIEVDVLDAGTGFDAKRLTAGGAGGLGLFSLRERLDYLNGRLHVESAPGKGTCFRIIVPFGTAPLEACIERAQSATASARPRDQGADAGKIRVLLADNHAGLRRNLALLLENQPDLEIIGEAGDGVEAVALAHQLQPDVVLMDMSMPKLNGVEATRLISRDLPSMAVIGLSMYDDSERAQAIRAAGALDFKTKSGAAEELIAAIRSVHRLAQSRGRRD